MTVPTLLITVTGPGGRRDLAAPADVPAGTLLGPLVHLLGGSGPAGPDPTGQPWELRSPAGTPIRPEQTLPDAGVQAGASLALTRQQPPGSTSTTTRPPAVATAGRVQLPPRHTSRWQDALGELLTPGQATQPAEASRWRRAHQTWQAGDYQARLRAGLLGAQPARTMTIAVLATAPALGVTMITRLLAATLGDLRVGTVRVVGHPRNHQHHNGSAQAQVLLVDAGPLLRSGAAWGAIARADQLVVITDTTPVTASHTVRATRPLLAAGRPVTLVVNHQRRPPGQLDGDRLADLLPTASGPVTVPHAPAAVARLTDDTVDGSRHWRQAALELAWLLVGAWTTPERAPPAAATVPPYPPQPTG
jgi:WXG100 protein secretion system (Wss), protein YukD